MYEAGAVNVNFPYSETQVSEPSWALQSRARLWKYRSFTLRPSEIVRYAATGRAVFFGLLHKMGISGGLQVLAAQNRLTARNR